MGRVITNDQDFISVSNTATADTGPLDSGSAPQTLTVEQELATLEALKASSPSTFFGTRVKRPGGGYWTGSGVNKAKPQA
jgi:hypothetical protein